MKAGTRLVLYALGLLAAFGAAFWLAGAIVPESVVTAWAEEGETHGDEHGETGSSSAGHTRSGLSLDSDGFVLSPVSAPPTVGAPGSLSFQILDQAGKPVTDFTTAHEKDLHLIVVRADGSKFRHVHPELDTATGTWSAPWSWDAAGSYRVYADFTPTGEQAEGVTLSRAVQVAGDFAPVQTAVQRTDEVDGFAAEIEGHLTTGEPSELTISISRGGRPVTTLEPYLGAFGHLVVLREGDLAYLHAHAEGAGPRPGDTAGPTIAFAATAPTAGRYLLYLDFQVDGEVHTAEFVLDTGH